MNRLLLSKIVCMALIALMYLFENYKILEEYFGAFGVSRPTDADAVFGTL